MSLRTHSRTPGGRGYGRRALLDCRAVALKHADREQQDERAQDHNLDGVARLVVVYGTVGLVRVVGGCSGGCCGCHAAVAKQQP